MKNDQGIETAVTMNVHGIEQVMADYLDHQLPHEKSIQTEWHILTTILFDPGIPLSENGIQKPHVVTIRDSSRVTNREYVPPRPVYHVRDDKYIITLHNHDSFIAVARWIAKFLVMVQGRNVILPGVATDAEPELTITYDTDEVKRRLDYI